MAILEEEAELPEEEAQLPEVAEGVAHPLVFLSEAVAEVAADLHLVGVRARIPTDEGRVDHSGWT